MKVDMKTVLAAAFASVIFAPVVNASTTTYYMNGTSPNAIQPGPVVLSLGPTTINATAIGYPASFWPLEGKDTVDSSVAIGTKHLDNAIRSTNDPTQVVCASQGCVAKTQEQKNLLKNPPPQDISFVDIADPTAERGIMGRNPGVYIPVLNLTFVGTVDTPYNETVVVRQYDGIADWPARQWNLVSDANAVMGAAYLHGPGYGNIDLSTIVPTVKTNSKGGVISTYVAPTTNLPLVQPLRDLGVPKPIVDAVQKPLKKIVDAGYQPNPLKGK